MMAMFIIFFIDIACIASTQIRDVRILYVNDIANRISEEVLNATLQYLNDRNFSINFDLIRVTANGSNDQQLIPSLCDTYNTLVKNHTPPDLILDTTMTGITSDSVKAFTVALALPTLSTSFGQTGDIREWRQLNEEMQKYMIQVNPPADIIPSIIEKIVLRQNMSNAAILFDKTFVMNHKFKSLLKNTGIGHSVGAFDGDNIESQLKKLHRLFFVNFFILGDLETINRVLDAAASNSYLNEAFSWYLISQEIGELIVNCSNCYILVAHPVLNDECVEELGNRVPALNHSEITTAFYFDLISKTFLSMGRVVAESNGNLGNFISCEEYYESRKTPHGRNVDLLGTMRQENLITPTCGPIKLVSNGHSQVEFDMELNIIKVVNETVEERILVGTWKAGLDNDINIIENQLMQNFTSTTFIRVQVEEQDPLIFRDENHPSGFNGYCIDLLDELAKNINFKYKIKLAPGNTAGIPHSNGSWSGLIGSLMKDEADLGMALYVSARRERVIDFTVPIYDLVGISILMKTVPVPVNHFKFVTVFENEVWFCILAAYFFTSTLMWFFAKFSPFAQPELHKRLRNREEKSYRIFTLTECLWFCMTSLTPQGGGEAPKNLSSRLVAAAWYLFAFIIISSYTANLAAFLTVSRVQTSINSLEDLSKQFKVQYAPTTDSLALEYFENMAYIEGKLYQIWEEMSVNDSLSDIERAKLAVWDYPIENKYFRMLTVMRETGFPHSLEEAIARVKHSRSSSEGFAFIGDATDVKYAALVNCDLTVVGEEFSVKPVAFATQENSPLRKLIDENLLKLLKQRVLQKLKEKWWNNHPQRKDCPAQEDNSDGMSVRTMGGVFLLLFVGNAVACVILLFDYLWLKYIKTQKVVPRENIRIVEMQKKKGV